MSTPATPTLTERILRREQVVIAAGLAIITALAWIYVLTGAGTGMSTIAMTTWQFPPPRPSMMMTGEWGATYWLTMLIMWWVMMVAMMLPSATPMLLLFARLSRKDKGASEPLMPAGMFAAGYLIVWGLFSLAAAGLQWAMEAARLMSPMLEITNVWLGAAILVAAGLWQLTPMKTACLRHCRSPLGFLIGNWRPGRWGALRMGLEHGAYCFGCCWFLMALLFFGGVMNLFWIVGIAAFVLLEKTIPLGHWLGRAAGVALVVWGLSLPVL